MQIVPLEVIVRNVAAGSFSKRYGVEEGTALKSTGFEFSYKNDEMCIRDRIPDLTRWSLRQTA